MQHLKSQRRPLSRLATVMFRYTPWLNTEQPPPPFRRKGNMFPKRPNNCPGDNPISTPAVS